MEFLVLIAAAIRAGVLNTVVGAGTFLTFPALVLAGMPPLVTNATSTVPARLLTFWAIWAAQWAFAQELSGFYRRRLLRLAGITISGWLVGSGLLLGANQAFSVWGSVSDVGRSGGAGCVSGGDSGSVSGGTVWRPLQRWASHRSAGAVLPMGIADPDRMNALKSGLSFLLLAISVAEFAAAGLVAWPQAVVMIKAATAGGYAGAPLARALPKPVVRGQSQRWASE